MKRTKNRLLRVVKNILIIIGFHLLSTFVTILIFSLADWDDSSNAGMIFVLSVALTARFTDGYLWGILSACTGSIIVNWAFINPFMKFDITPQGYALTFFVMLAVAMLISMLTTQVKEDIELKATMRREKLRSDLLRSVSHDIRTPLTAISAAAGAYLDNAHKLDETTKAELVCDIKRESDWLTRAFDNILTITRVGIGAESFTKRPEVAEEVIGEVIGLFRKRCGDISVTVDLPDDLVIVPMDALLIEQVFKNLMENARDHGGCVTEINIRLRVENGMAVFSVEDNGKGIPPELLGSLFNAEALDRIKYKADGTRGMGIGLELCSSVVKLHGGTMRGYNGSNGAVFEFTLPME